MPVQVPQLPSCVISKDPFIKLGGGVAPSLNYNLPQKTSFTAYGDVRIPAEDTWFTPAAKAAINQLNVTDVKKAILNLVVYPNQAIPSNLQVVLSSSNLNSLKDYYNKAITQNTVTSIIDFVVNHANSSNGTYGVSVDYMAVLNNYINYLAAMVIDTTKTAISVPNFGNYYSNLIVADRPATPQPTLFIIEEYKTSSFLGDYGAGQTINTFSLLPGEKHTIAVKTFKSLTSTSTRSDNVMDSFSQNSADEFENLLQTEKQSANSKTDTTGKQSGGSIGLSIKGFSIGGNKSKSSSSTATRTSNQNSISKALQKHTDSTNSNRSITVNSSTTQTSTETNEESTVREISNPNFSRVLNFVFRQLLQEYISITYLNDIKIGFTNGNPESFRVVNIEELDVLLGELVDPLHHSDVKQMIWNEYHTIENYKGDKQIFLDETNASDWDGITPKNYYHKRKIITGNYTYQGADGPKQITVGGPILNVDLNTLRTDSLVVDALLGQGEALDCFNSHSQNAKTQALYIDNDKLVQEQTKIQIALDTLNAIADPAARADAYSKMFNPQVQNIIN